ncbi:MAG: Sensor histidine kinase RcsC [Chlamydiia bacterium]|nr:Sensor histidine kinase RcsC [Chlamydiia bacterium]
MEFDDPEFAKQLIETFKMEAAEHLEKLSEAFLQLEKDFQAAGTDEMLEMVGREAHSLKGASRAVGFDLIQNLFQSFEDLLVALRKKEVEPSKEFFQLAFEFLDYSKQIIDSPDREIEEIDTYNSLLSRIGEVIQNIPHNQDNSPPQKVEKAEQTQPKIQAKSPVAGEKKVQFELEDSYLKVSAKKLDSLIVKIENLLSIKSGFDQIQSEIKRLHGLMLGANQTKRLLESVGSEVIRLLEGSEQDRLKGKFDALYQSFHESCDYLIGEFSALVKTTQSEGYILGGLVKSLLNDGRELVLQPFSSITDPFNRMVRDISQQLQKEVEFEVEGKGIRIDRRILDQLKDPMMHLIRNAIDHGIEVPEERESKGKNRSGRLKIAINRIGGSQVEVTVKDDGRGFDTDLIAEKIVQDGLIPAEQVKSISFEELIQFAFKSGVSTAKQVSELSGRGIGLNVIEDNLMQIGGNYSTTTDPGKGTCVMMRIPISSATLRGITVLVSDRPIIIPVRSIARVFTKEKYELSLVGDQMTLFFEDQNVPYVQLGDLLEIKREKLESDLAIVLEHEGMTRKQMVALGVDAVDEEQEIFVKGLGRQLVHIPFVSAATIIQGKKIVPILSIQDLFTSMFPDPMINIEQTQNNEEAKGVVKKHVLVVEDTQTTLFLICKLVKDLGYQVSGVNDGKEAVDLLSSQKIDLVVTDIEMPNFDGIQLIEAIRNNQEWKHIPVIVVTGCEVENIKQSLTSLGVNGLIEKSSFMEQQLREMIGKVI